MLYKTTAIILHYIKYSETSVIVYCYTRHFGRMSLIIPGVRKKNARIKLNQLQPLQVCEIDFWHKEKQGLMPLKELRTLHLADNIPVDHNKSTVALFLAEVLYKTLKEEVKNETLFQFLEDHINLLNKVDQNLSLFYLQFLTDYTTYLGFHPNTDNMENSVFFDQKNGLFCMTKPGHGFFLEGRQLGYLKKLLDPDKNTYPSFLLPPGERIQLLDHLMDYYMLHVDGFTGLKSPAVLREVFRG